MAKKYLISFATPEFEKAQKLLCKSTKEFDIVFKYGPRDIDSKFYKKNYKILSQKKGAGYWLWKPYFIKKTLEKMNEGDVLVYIDSDYKFLGAIGPLISACEKNKGVLLFEQDEINKMWTKRDCFVILNADSRKYWDEKQLEAGFQIYIKTRFSSKFVNDYLKYCKNENLITDLPNIYGKQNFPEFKEHRHDQSILTILSIKYDLRKARFLDYFKMLGGKNVGKVITSQFGIFVIMDNYMGKIGKKIKTISDPIYRFLKDIILLVK